MNNKKRRNKNGDRKINFHNKGTGLYKSKAAGADIYAYDTTLRDGSQGEGISFSLDDKIKIALKLDALGVAYIEGGWPGSNPKDMEFFQRIRDYKLDNARIVAFGSTRRPGIPAYRDNNLESILESGVRAAALFGKSWDFHVISALNTSLEENLSMVRESILFLKKQELEVIFDAEHYFDGFKNNPDYALKVVGAAADAGADWIVMCDTNGGTMPWEVARIVRQTRLAVKAPLGIHAHNDAGCAVANSLVAIHNGCTQIQGTANGYGERCGNADLCVVIPGLELKLGRKVLPPGNIKNLMESAHSISGIANMPFHKNHPYVGQGAFAHKGGIHVSAIMKDSLTYEHISPEDVGNRRRIIISELSGISNLLSKAGEFNININEDTPETVSVVRQIKELENLGYQFEAADASLALFLLRAFGKKHSCFQFRDMEVIFKKNWQGETITVVKLKVIIEDQVHHTVTESDGTVNAFFDSLKKVLTGTYPEVDGMHLTGYRLRVLKGINGAPSRFRVLVESADISGKWCTIGVSENIIEASVTAIEEGINYMLLKKREKTG